nr:CHRD domain-containing protein [Pyrinomonadaceae bacterium]
MTNKKFNLFYVLTILLFCVSFAKADVYFTGNLNAAQEVPPNASTATGFGRVTLNNAETQITVSVYYSGLTSPGVSVGHIHGPAAVGSNGPVIFNLNPTAGVTSGSVVNATFAVTPTQVADLKAGLWYFNIHTTTNSGGEIRGQITVDAPYIASLNGGQENPPVSTGATGSGAVSINAAGTQAIVTVRWAGLSGNATAGHVHSGRSRV